MATAFAARSFRQRLGEALSDKAGKMALITGLVAVLIGLPQVLDNDAALASITDACAYAMLALGLNIVVGFTGLLDLGYAAFFAIGAYFYGVLSSYQVLPEWGPFWQLLSTVGLVEKINQGGPDLAHFTLSFWLALPLAGIVSAGCGILFGAPTLRLRGDYLAIVTLGFGEIVPIIARNSHSITGGASGLNGVRPPSIGGESFGVDTLPYYWTALIMVGVLIFASNRLRDSRVGRAWMAIREDEIGAGAMGVNLVRSKLMAFALGAAFAGIAGVFYVSKLQTATPEMFGFPVSTMILVMVVLGGLGSVWGVVLAAVFLQLLQSWFLPDLTEWLHALGRGIDNQWLQGIDLARGTELIFGVILVLMMLFRREGLIPATRRQAALNFDAQNVAGVVRGGFADVSQFVTRAADAPALEVKGVTVRFGGLVALNAVDLSVPSGSVVAVIGPNGSGKSTLFNVITGLVSANGGSITFGGRELLGRKPHEILRMGVARTFQNLRVFPSLTVLDNVMVGQHARLRTGPFGAVLRPPRAAREESAARQRALGIIALFGNRLQPRITQMAGLLSYANRRRVEIARALASRPKILLLDEPTAGMNPAETLELADQIKSLHAAGMTVLLIEHKLDVVTQLADKVVVLDHGEKIAEGRPEEVRRNEEVLRAYLGRAATAAAVAEAGRSGGETVHAA